MSINPHEIDHLTGDTITMPPLHIYEDSAGQPHLVKRAPVRHEGIVARETHVEVVTSAPRRTQIEQFAWDRADWFTEKWTAFVDAEGESLTPIFDEVKRDHEQSSGTVQIYLGPVTITRLRKMKVAELRAWVVENFSDEKRVALIRDGAGTKGELLAIARNILAKR